MTYPENRQPLSLNDFTAPHYDSQGRRVLRHPSTWDAECAELRAELRDAESAVSWHELRAITAIDEAKALRARVEALEAALHKIATWQSYRLPSPQEQARAALQQEATTAPQSGPDNG